MYRYKRILFMSPAEARLIRILGGTVLTLPFIKSRKNRFPFTLVLDMGTIFKSENMQREVRVGKYYVDFGNDLKRGIEVDGRRWHSDILKEMERDDYLNDRGWSIMHITAKEIYGQPYAVRQRVSYFLDY